ncbi:hypothetical protein BDW02DRAFT_620055 [Decorospora gaudefroyi]|uniref:Uncharacterized protein n=1 Tax=Decorospora gaudefroyi TaxID=184978 RepID=A0A6A5KW61_9PLEO|nr:hypothetical protein BDW02DRAFT_620055 [Decorospora gaudefroyi]
MSVRLDRMTSIASTDDTNFALLALTSCYQQSYNTEAISLSLCSNLPPMSPTARKTWVVANSITHCQPTIGPTPKTAWNWGEPLHPAPPGTVRTHLLHRLAVAASLSGTTIP